MKLNEFYHLLDGLAPKRLSDEYCAKTGAYDNSGVLVDTGEDVKGALFALDLTNSAIDKAIELGANLIVTHHPVIYGKISDIRQDDLLGRKLVRCIKNGISIVSMHLNLDVAQGGIDESLMQGVCLSTGRATGENVACMHALEGGAYGRAYDVAEVRLGALAEGMKNTFSTQKLLVYGDMDGKVKRVASFCGAGADEETLRFAKAQGADVVISSDFKHHLISYALEEGMQVIVLTHYASEQYGYKKYYEKMRRQTSVACTYHVEDELF